ncbi:MAG: nitronate monooxygenase [Eggerthellaceae bacterium]|jgi:enoyl-[acyl-carrier protein] reductase II
MKTRLTELLGIEYPIIQGAMAHITNGKFAGTVSEAGGLGVIQSGFDVPEVVRNNIRDARAVTDKPFAVNLIMESEYVADNAKVVIEEHVPAVTISAGKPDEIVPILVSAGVKVMVLVPHVRAAKKMEAMGVSAVIVEGMESGGHIGRQTTMPFVRQVAENVDIPVVAAGGICDGHGFLAALALGACGVQMGTAFLATEECPISDVYKQLIIDSDDTSSTLTGQPGGKQVRCIENQFTRGYWNLFYRGASDAALDAYCTGSISRAKRGDLQGGAFSAGMIAGAIKEIKPVKKLLDDTMSDAACAYQELKDLFE